MRNGKRTLFPSGGEELDLCQLRAGRTSPLYTPNHLSFKGMFMFAHFSPPIVLLEETEPMRRMLQKFLCALQCTWGLVQPLAGPAQGAGLRWLLDDGTQLCGEEKSPLSDALMSDHDRALECPGVTLLGNQKVIGKRRVETLRVKPKPLNLKLMKEHNLVNLVFLLRVLLASAPLISS